MAPSVARSVSRRLSVLLLALAANFLAAAPLLAEETTRPGVDTTALLRVTIGLAVVLAVIVALGWLIKRLQGFSQPGTSQLRVLGGVSVGTKERVVLLQVGQQQLLLGVAPGRVQTLHVLDKPLEDAGNRPGVGVPGAGQQSGFQNRLRELMQRQQGKPDA
ncbi:MAG: flagellar biosynthetic protein FliO [Ectothiorhodospiraceae bacterium]|nr:flagellar biosynthetic protein FliO [Ectothiorhodospiraceae bacterium]